MELAWKVERLTACPVSNLRVEPLHCCQSLLKLVDVLSHYEEPLVWLSDAREGVEKGVGEVVDEACGWFLSRGMGDMLVHVHMLRMGWRYLLILMN